MPKAGHCDARAIGGQRRLPTAAFTHRARDLCGCGARTQADQWPDEGCARGRKARCTRRPDELTLSNAVAERIAAERATGASMSAIAEGLNRDNVPTRQGGARW